MASTFEFRFMDDIFTPKGHPFIVFSGHSEVWYSLYQFQKLFNIKENVIPKIIWKGKFGTLPKESGLGDCVFVILNDKKVLHHFWSSKIKLNDKSDKRIILFNVKGADSFFKIFEPIISSGFLWIFFLKHYQFIKHGGRKRISYSARDRYIAASNQDHKCAWCGNKFLDGLFELDHFITFSEGGSNHKINLQALCVRCHNEKSQHENYGGYIFQPYDHKIIIPDWHKKAHSVQNIVYEKDIGAEEEISKEKIKLDFEKYKYVGEKYERL